MHFFDETIVNLLGIPTAAELLNFSRRDKQHDLHRRFSRRRFKANDNLYTQRSLSLDSALLPKGVCRKKEKSGQKPGGELRQKIKGDHYDDIWKRKGEE